MVSGGKQRCTCSASLCRHDLGGCLNHPSVEVTVSAERGSEPEGRPNITSLCEKFWAFLQIRPFWDLINRNDTKRMKKSRNLFVRPTCERKHVGAEKRSWPKGCGGGNISNGRSPMRRSRSNRLAAQKRPKYFAVHQVRSHKASGW